MDPRAFTSLQEYLEKIPAIIAPIESGADEYGNWWVKFQIDIDHALSWHTVQEIGCVVNYLSIEERLPAVFYPVSPAPYLNGGPEEFLSWVIESKDTSFKPGTLMKWLEERLPDPVNDEKAWSMDE
jgi:hypothetical protein